MKHLSEEQFVAWASGERDEQAGQHLRECPQCLAEVRELNAALEGFKTQIAQRAEARAPFFGHQVRARAEARSGSLWRFVPVPALAAAAVLAFMVYEPALPPITDAKTPQQVAVNDEADNALLLAISADVQRAAPAALRPVAQLNKERNALLTGSQENANQRKK